MSLALSRTAHAQAQQLIGTWGLTGWDETASDGSVTHPLGLHSKGRLVFDAAGSFLLTVISERQKMLPADSNRPVIYSETYAAFGRYTVEPAMITYHIERSTFPNLESSRAMQSYIISADQLICTVGVIGSNQAVSETLTWKRLH